MTIYDIFPFLRVFSNPLVLLLIAILALLILSIALYSRPGAGVSSAAAGSCTSVASGNSAIRR